MRAFITVCFLVLGFNAYSQDSFTDPRDDVSYVIVEIEGLNWFENNLQFKTDSSRFFDESDRSKSCGQFYIIEDAFEVCPAGWRLPNEKEVKELIKMDKRVKIDLMDTLKVDMCGRIDAGKAAKQGIQNTYWIQVELDGTYATHWHFFPDEIKVHHHNVAQRHFPVRCVRELD